jgi:D-sedoheptulose 7-phosphate isomerase
MVQGDYFERTADVLNQLAASPPPQLDELADSILTTWSKGGRIISCGNGGSAADSQHFVTELVARFDEEPIHKPAVSLTADSSTLTAISNDWSFEEVFSRQVRAQLDSDDVFLGISTSGNSENVLKAIVEANTIGADCFGLTGSPPGRLADADCTVISVPSDRTPHIQEAHSACLHYVCDLIDGELND